MLFSQNFFFCLLIFIFSNRMLVLFFSCTVLNFDKFSLVFKLIVYFTVSYSLLNFAMFFFKFSIFKWNFCLHFSSVFCVVRTSHSSLLQWHNAASFFCPNIQNFSARSTVRFFFYFVLSKPIEPQCTYYSQSVVLPLWKRTSL